MPFNSREYEFADVTLLIGGQDMQTIQSVKYTEKTEKEVIYGKGRKPRSIQRKNYSCEGEIGLLQSEVEPLIQQGLLTMSVDIQVTYGNTPDEVLTKRIIGVQFTEVSQEMKQGDGFMTISLPFIALDVEHN